MTPTPQKVIAYGMSFGRAGLDTAKEEEEKDEEGKDEGRKDEEGKSINGLCQRAPS